MKTWVGDLAASVGALVLLVTVPAGIAVGLAVAEGQSLAPSLARLRVGTDLLASLIWVTLFLAWSRLAARHPARTSLLPNLPLAALAVALAMLWFYRTEPLPYAFLYASQYAVLVLLAHMLFTSVRSWLLP